MFNSLIGSANPSVTDLNWPQRLHSSHLQSSGQHSIRQPSPALLLQPVPASGLPPLGATSLSLFSGHPLTDAPMPPLVSPPDAELAALPQLSQQNSIPSEFGAHPYFAFAIHELLSGVNKSTTSGNEMAPECSADNAKQNGAPNFTVTKSLSPARSPDFESLVSTANFLPYPTQHRSIIESYHQLQETGMTGDFSERGGTVIPVYSSDGTPQVQPCFEYHCKQQLTPQKALDSSSMADFNNDRLYSLTGPGKFNSINMMPPSTIQYEDITYVLCVVCTVETEPCLKYCTIYNRAICKIFVSLFCI